MAWLAWLFRHRCIACRVWAGDSLCDDCRRTWPAAPSGPVPEGLDGLLVGAAHRVSARAAVHAAKYRGRRAAVGVLAEALLRVPCWPTGAWLVVPVPLHRERLRRRGFNQSARLARAVARRRGWPWAEPLTRAHATPTLHGMSPAARSAAVAGAFRCGRLTGRRILLVDDVLTTGATARACAAALREAGAEEVWLAVATRAPLPG